ncbi:hypothetical protein [Streptomyces sp. NBC_00503]|nr:hypothetical protein [Streptomyces sp. NBC_00503]WUD86464.1 hypothetical protein OG490_38305 [Streptomyces sp. NBC_00503]
MMEWIAPEYADVIEVMRQAQSVQAPDRNGPVPVRGFIVAEPDEG